MENDILIKKKKEYRLLSIFVSVLLLISLFVVFKNLNKDYDNSIVILSENPEFKIHKTIKTTSYWIELKFKNDKDVYKISETEYKYVNKNEFTKDLVKGEKIEILHSENQIYKLTKDNKEYLNYDLARKHDLKTKLIVGLLYIFVIAFSIWVYSLNEMPKINFGEKTIILNIDYVFFGLLILLLLILEITIGLNYFFNKEFMT
jgi:hypothetical protein